MKVTAALVLLAAFSIPASAKTITTSQGNADEQSVAGVAGPAAAAHSTLQTKVSAQQSAKKAHHRSKVRTPPPMHDPN